MRKPQISVSVFLASDATRSNSAWFATMTEAFSAAHCEFADPETEEPGTVERYDIPVPSGRMTRAIAIALLSGTGFASNITEIAVPTWAATGRRMAALKRKPCSTITKPEGDA